MSLMLCALDASGSSAFPFLSFRCFVLVPSKTLEGFPDYAPRQSSGKTKDEVKVLAHQTAGGLRGTVAQHGDAY